MPTAHLLVGPVGAGKSTRARVLAAENHAVWLELDNWMGRLFRSDRPETGLVAWYVERADRCVAQIWDVALAVIAVDRDVVLELGMLERRQRERFYRQVERAGLRLVVHVVDASREVRCERVRERNAVEAAVGGRVVPAAVFEMASDRWEPFDAAEVARLEAVGFVVRGFEAQVV